MDAMNGINGLSTILGELSYPAQKWQITTCAEIHGAGAGIHDELRAELDGLPVRTYETANEIATALAALRADVEPSGRLLSRRDDTGRTRAASGVAGRSAAFGSLTPTWRVPS